MDRETFKQIHNSVITRFPIKKGWDYNWFLDRLLDRNYAYTRYGWFLCTINKYLVEDMKVVDIAGAFGMYGAYLQLIEGRNFDYTVLDLPIMQKIFDDYIKELKFKGQFVVGDIRFKLPLEVGKYDMVWLFSWCQIEGVNCETFFREINRILKQDGIFMLNMAYSHYVTKYGLKDLVGLMENTGFEIQLLERQYAHAPEFVVIAKKVINA